MPEPRKDPKTKRGKQEVQYQRTQKPVKRKNRVPKEGEPTYEAGHKNKLKASTVVDHRLSRKHPTSTLLVGSVHANIKRALKVPWGSDDDHDDGEGLADLEKEPRIHEVAGQEDTLVDNINAEQEDKEEQNPDAHVLSTSLSNAIGTIQLLRIQLYEVLALDLDRIFGPKLPPGTSSVTLQAPSIASATFQPLAHITPTSSSSVLSPLSPLATPSTDMSPMDTPQPTQKMPGPACTIEQLNLSSADRQDIGDIVSTSLTFYYQVVSLMLNGSLSSNSQYERNRSAPERTMPTRSNKTASRAPLVVPHSVRAYEHYCAVTGVVPFNLRPGATAMTTMVPRLAAISVQTSFRQHYLASSFSGDDGKDLEPPKDNVDRVCWFHIHNWTRDEYAHFPKSRFTPTFVHLSEADMLEVFYLDETARAIALERLEVKTISQARKLVVEKKGLLIQLLLYPVEADLMPRPSGYHDNLTLQSNGRTSKLKLRGTICSNGLELHLLAYDTTKLRRSPKNKDGSTDDCSGSDADLDGLFDEPGEDEDDLLDEPVLDLDDSECVMTPKRRRLDSVAGSISDGESTNAGLIQHGGEPIPRSGGGTSRYPDGNECRIGTIAREDTTMEPVWKINYGRGSKLLPNVEKEFETPVQCVDWDSRPIVSVDPGEKKPFCAIRMGPRSGPRTEDNKSEREVLNVSKAFLYRPVVEFRNAHQHRLASVDLDLVVSGIPPLRIGAVERYLAYLESASTGQNSEETEGQKGHPGDERTVRARIEDFYIRNRWFVKKSWDAKKAQNASYNYV
ncbi:MAG: hypothetical protein J3R72DRAFT_428451 [Linnemannia gamsii]|nr:MAG: hypothetical protein J3R72DRAFT_428451 [Linnemannia gamsii]